ncbi:GH116 family glycosyl-hydrolase [Microbulbifer agarilyticus]|uniref:GH116 family glycosyl-hydrolase n=1 Tax=Microbulbifer agarilyticus TaxID=260552 RepID=UPI001CD61FBE|nr:GH116 family glycosyl-hydrolase [Microbulbifer agarilyticus]MCA0900817.1 non-lysosomal glucosylceramidase [Microbulbifer agarilyticus]
MSSLYERGKATTYHGWEQLQYIGMPVGGIGSGTVYIGGDGKLWVWDIFNEAHEGVVPQLYEHPTLRNEHGCKEIKERNGANYISPPAQISPWHFDQGFAVTVTQDGETVRRTLDRNGFEDITFTGQAPIAQIQYRDPAIGLGVELEAMTAFIPLDTDRSSYPATIMRYRFRNHSDREMAITADAWSVNPSLQGRAAQHGARLVNTEYTDHAGAGFFAGCEAVDPDNQSALEQLADYGSFSLFCVASEGASTTVTVVQPVKEGGKQLAQVANTIATNRRLSPGETAEVTFIVAWHFPNQKALYKDQQDELKRWYASKFHDARAVALEVGQSLEELTGLTRLWRDTWYDSTLPHWLLERSIIPTNALQTNTTYRLDNGRFWAWEGVGCCAGTCTHVWHYAQAVGRLFPDLERDLRERTDYGLGFQENGAILFRGEYGSKDASDGQAGVILRTLREHQMSPGSGFLQRVWPNTKKALQYLIAQDARDGIPDGIPTGEQHNTLDAEWYGKIPVISSLYIAALRAGEEMARVMGDTAFAGECRNIAARGRENILSLYRKDYGFFVQEIDPNHADAIAIGDGCYIDQVIGQWWAYQLGLGRLYDGATIRKALSSLWDYNFCPDMGVLRDSITNPRAKGRTYALAGEAGLVMCTWPEGGRKDNWEEYWQYGYFNECMTGFEYQVAGHMIWESDEQSALLTKGLAITRAVHDRYHASKRNPYNEIECSDHYARAMASYGVFLAACGFEYDGPSQHLGFKPRLTANGDFKSAFTAAEGWGSFAQTDNRIELKLHYGELSLKTLSIRRGEIAVPSKLETSRGMAMVSQSGKDITLAFDEPLQLAAGETLSLVL